VNRIRSLGLSFAVILAASAAQADPAPRATPEAPLPPAGPIYNEAVDAHLPADLVGTDRATVRYVMLKIEPAKRPLMRWLGNGDSLIIYLQTGGTTSVAYQNIAPSMDSNEYYNLDTGETFPAMDERPSASPVKLKNVPAGWKLYPYSHAPHDPAPLKDDEIAGFIPASLSPQERADAKWALEFASAQERRWIRWAHPRQSPPRTEKPAFGFAVYMDDPYNRDGPNVCFPNLALGKSTTQYWCPYYREALVDPGPNVIGTATTATYYNIQELDTDMVAKQQPAWVQVPYSHPPLHPQPLLDTEIASYLPRDVAPKDAEALWHILSQAPPQIRRWIGWGYADVIGAGTTTRREFAVFLDSVDDHFGPTFCMENLVGPPDHYYCPSYHKIVVGPSNPLLGGNGFWLRLWPHEYKD
jgi:hypothetical protein